MQKITNQSLICTQQSANATQGSDHTPQPQYTQYNKSMVSSADGELWQPYSKAQLARVAIGGSGGWLPLPPIATSASLEQVGPCCGTHYCHFYSLWHVVCRFQYNVWQGVFQVLINVPTHNITATIKCMLFLVHNRFHNPAGWAPQFKSASEEINRSFQLSFSTIIYIQLGGRWACRISTLLALAANHLIYEWVAKECPEFLVYGSLLELIL